LVEACVTTVEEAVACVRVGADRLELCRDLDVGGLTPDPGLLRRVKSEVSVPVFAMARPRAGSFVFDAAEVERTATEIHSLVEAGADGIVLGLLTPERRVNEDSMPSLLTAAGALPVTFHRAFDGVFDPGHAMDALVGLGLARVLTAGGSRTAAEGAASLASLVHRAGGALEVLAGGGVRGHNVVELVRTSGVREVHARAEGVAGVVQALRGRAA
jgi:copper homeostasis protein